MNAKDVLLQTIGMGDHILNAYLGDLSDADLLLRPVEGQNHIAWQLGHLISSERSMVETRTARLEKAAVDAKSG